MQKDIGESVQEKENVTVEGQHRMLTLLNQLDGRMQTNDAEISSVLKAEIMGVHDISQNNTTAIETKYNNML